MLLQSILFRSLGTLPKGWSQANQRPWPGDTQETIVISSRFDKVLALSRFKNGQFPHRILCSLSSPWESSFRLYDTPGGCTKHIRATPRPLQPLASHERAEQDQAERSRPGQRYPEKPRNLLAIGRKAQSIRIPNGQEMVAESHTPQGDTIRA